MACGLPVITTDIMGCPEIINQACGYMVPSNDSKALKQAILDFSALSESKKIRMRRSARQRVQSKFDAALQGVKLSRLIEQVDYGH